MINLGEPDEYKGTHPNADPPVQLYTANSVGSTVASSTGSASLECIKSYACINPFSLENGHNPSKATSTTILDTKEVEEHTDSTAKLGEVTVTMSEDNSEFEAIVRNAEEAQQPTMLESSTKS